MASELVKASVNSTWTDIVGAAAGQAGVYWQNVGSLPLFLSFTTASPSASDGYVVLSPGLSFHDDTGSAHVWAKCSSGVSTLTATLDPAAGGGGGGGGLTNAELRASPVGMFPAGIGYTDQSNATLSGSSEALIAANAARQVLFVSNIGSATVWLNLAGGTAAADTAGCLPILAGGTLLLDTNAPTGAINIIGTAGQPVTAYEG